MKELTLNAAISMKCAKIAEPRTELSNRKSQVWVKDLIENPVLSAKLLNDGYCDEINFQKSALKPQIKIVGNQLVKFDNRESKRVFLIDESVEPYQCQLLGMVNGTEYCVASGYARKTGNSYKFSINKIYCNE